MVRQVLTPIIHANKSLNILQSVTLLFDNEALDKDVFVVYLRNQYKVETIV